MFDFAAFKLAQLFRKIKGKSPLSAILSNAFSERPDFAGMDEVSPGRVSRTAAGFTLQMF
jgi:hypothetical protein